MRAGLVCVVLLASVGCKSKGSIDRAEGSQTGSAEPAAPTGWKRVEALATPTVSAGASKDLDRAMQIAKENEDAWRELKFKHPPTPQADYPHGADALEALHAWVQGQGGLPAVAKPPEIGSAALQMRLVGGIAIDGATDARAASIDDGMYLATRLVAEGRNFLEVQVGLSLFGEAKRKRLSIEEGGSAAAFEPPALDLVRVLAAEAMQSRRTMDYATTPEGRKDFIDRAKGLEPDTKQVIEGVTGRTPLSMIPTDEEAAGLMQFWLAALDGAQRGEPAETTIARVEKAAETAPASAQVSAAAIARMVAMLKGEYARLSEPPPF